MISILDNFLNETSLLSEADNADVEKKKKGEKNEDPDLGDEEGLEDNKKDPEKNGDFDDVANEIETNEKMRDLGKDDDFDNPSDETDEGDSGIDDNDDFSDDSETDTAGDLENDDGESVDDENDLDNSDEENSDMTSDDENENIDDEQNNDEDDEEKIKNRSLLQNYFDLYSKIVSMIQSLSNVEGNNKFEFSTITTIGENLNDLKYNINDYINIRFAKRTYEENLSMYYKMINSLKITDKIISNIVENRTDS